MAAEEVELVSVDPPKSPVMESRRSEGDSESTVVVVLEV
jgi:hypothetical protein